MLYKSGNNLEQGALTFLMENERIVLFSAYIKVSELEKINHLTRIQQIIVRWEVKDLCLGVSDLELYQYCKTNNIKLFRNTRIHLKAFWNQGTTLFFGSANVTNRGLGEKGNLELNGIQENMSFDDVLYLNSIIAQSEYVTDELFQTLEGLVTEIELPTIVYPEIPTDKKEVDYFLLSQLPMTQNVGQLFNIYNGMPVINEEEMNCAAHDIALYQVPSKLKFEEFEAYLMCQFNQHPFVVAFKEHIKNQYRQSLNYGGVVQWIVENTTTVPTPLRWEIKEQQIVNTLYDWIVLFDGDFGWSVPGARSQVIQYYKHI